MPDTDTLRVLDIVGGTSVDGPGLRTSIYLAGCIHHCPECHNPQSWATDGGTEMTVGEIMNRVRDEDFNVTLSGGDPLYQLDNVGRLASRIAAEGYTIWLYTGYTWEQMIEMPGIMSLLRNIEVVVDGPFVKSLRDVALRFRGSSNQRLIDVDASLRNGCVRLFE